MKIFVKEQLSAHKYKTPEGYLVCTDAILARTGKQLYKKRDFFPDAADADADYEVDRLAEDVFDEKAIASFENKPITVEHPDEDVNSHNYKQYEVGFVRDVHQGEVNGQPVLLGNLVIRDEQTIREIENGEHTDLSCGYDCDVLDEEHPAQKNIRGNHVALCREGRAGIARIQDSVKDDARTVTTQCYIIKGNQILVQDRVGPAWKGYAVPGGHVKADESPIDACIREVKEETGLDVRQLTLFGTHSYHCEEDGDSIAMLYSTIEFTGELHSSEEGKVFWMDIDEVLKSPYCAEGFQELLSKCVNNVQVVDSTTNDVEPKEGETKEDFIARFMRATKEEYPESKQRLAVAYSYWDKAHDSCTKDAYINTSSKYKEEAQQHGFRVEESGDKIRVWGSRLKLEQWIKSHDADEALNYAEVKDSKSVSDVLKVAKIAKIAKLSKK